MTRRPDNGQGQTEYSIDFPENVMADVLIVGGGGGGGRLVLVVAVVMWRSLFKIGAIMGSSFHCRDGWAGQFRSKSLVEQLR